MKLSKVKGSILVGLVLIAFVWWGSAKADTQLEIGPSQVGSTYSTGVMLTISERFQDKYEFTFGYITEQEFSVCDRPDCTWFLNEQLFFGTELLVSSPWTDKLKIGVGPYYFQNADRVSPTNFRAGISVEYRFNDRFGLRARHFSNAGSAPNIEICRDNRTWRNSTIYTPPQFISCMTNDWNTGQDSWLRFVWYF